MPPRHGKSELASRRFPAWYLGRNPSEQIIAASYNADLANDFGREVRNIVNSQDYKNVFDVELAQDSKAGLFKAYQQPLLSSGMKQFVRVAYGMARRQTNQTLMGNNRSVVQPGNGLVVRP